MTVDFDVIVIGGGVHPGVPGLLSAGMLTAKAVMES
jgi:hypothetical protein